MKKLILSLALMCLPLLMMAQVLKIAPEGPQCPGNAITYSTFMDGGPNPNYAYCSFKWSITNGKFFVTNSSADFITTSNSVAVIWNDVTQKGTLSVTLSGCNTASLNVSPTTGGVIINSVNGVTPSQVKVNNVAKTSHSVDWCSTAPITLSIDRLGIPNTPSQSNPSYPTALYVDQYEWTLPPGWSTTDNKTGTFTTTAYSIAVIPAAGVGGQVKVRGYNYECSISSIPRVNFYSNYSTLTIDREPVLGPISTSKTSVNCGDTNPLTLSVPALAGAASYTWSLPAGWVITSSPANANSVTVVPSGAGAGNVSVAATLTCSSPAKTVNASPLPIGYSNSLSTPVFSTAPYDIGSSTPYSVAAVPGATSYTWEASPNILINGQLSPQANLSSAVTLAQRPGYSGAGWVRVTANSAQCSGSQVYKEVWVGIPEVINFSYEGSMPNGFNYPACPYEQGAFYPVYNGYQGQVLEYRWTATNISQHLGLTDPVLYVVAGGKDQVGQRMKIGLEVRTSLGWSAKWVKEYEIRNCDGGEEPWFVVNPVTEDEFTIESTSASNQSSGYSLFDQQGNLKRSGKLNGKKTNVSTKVLPAGLYYLQLEQNGLVTKKRLLLQK